MDISSLLKKEMILLNLDVESKEEAISKMIAFMKKADFITGISEFEKVVLNREAHGSTGIGYGVAIPHGKSKDVRFPGIAFARLTQPIEWQSLDGKPVTMFFLIAVPEEKAGNEHLQILASISRKLVHEEFRYNLSTANSPQEIIDILKQAN